MVCCTFFVLVAGRCVCFESAVPLGRDGGEIPSRGVFRILEHQGMRSEACVTLP